MALPEQILNELLDRYVLILSAVADIQAEPRIVVEPINVPRVYCYVSRFSGSRSRYGNDFVAYDITVTMRLITGGVGSGSAGEKEGLVNSLGVRIVDTFANYYQLQEPTTKEEFRYLMPDIAERFVVFNGPTQFNYGSSQTPKLFVGTALVDEVKLLTKRK